MTDFNVDQVEGIVEAADKLFQTWKDCDECQYNLYVCRDHQYRIEPILAVVAPSYGMIVNDFQAVTIEE